MAFAQPPEDVGLDHGEALPGPVLQVLFDFLALEPLEDEPGRVTQVEEGLAVLVDEVAAVGADLELEALDRRPGLRFRRFRARVVRRSVQEEEQSGGDGEKRPGRDGASHGEASPEGPARPASPSSRAPRGTPRAPGPRW